MDKDYFTKLTSNLYHLTLLFPKKEPLRYKIRELGGDVLSSLILVLADNPYKSKERVFEIGKKLEILDSYFEVAKSQNWVNSFDVLEIQKEYGKIGKEIGEINATLVAMEEAKIRREKAAEDEGEEITETPLSSREGKILKLLEQKGGAKVGEIHKLMSGVTKRTIRRDFKQLFKLGLIEKKGTKNLTFYQLKKEESQSQ